VYRAKDPRLGRDVAIKVLPASFSNDADRLRRFEQEARAAGAPNHPNIAAVYDIGTNSQHEFRNKQKGHRETGHARRRAGTLNLPCAP
jgi:serine/threonine protein kinase